MSYQVGIDVGTTWTAAAVCRGGEAVEMVPLGERSPALPSAIHIGMDGVLDIGEAALRREMSDPAGVVQEFTRRIGDRTPVVAGGIAVPAEALATRFLAKVLQVVAEREGGPADRVAVAHPAGWGPHRLGALRHALGREGLGNAVLVAEPQAAAIGYARATRVETGAAIAVYDLGGGTFDAAVVRKTDAGGGFALLGRPQGIEDLGGVDFDAAVFDHVRVEIGTRWDALDVADAEVLAAVAALRRDCTIAKETLSQDTVAAVPVSLPDIHTTVRLQRAQFEEMIRPAIDTTTATLQAVIRSAAVADGDVPTVLLVGGSSRIPLVAQILRGLGYRVAVDVDPKGAVAIGAAVAASRIGRTPAGAARPIRQNRPTRPVAPPRQVPAVPATGTGRMVAPPTAPPKYVQPFHEPPSPARRRLGAVLGVLAVVVTALVVGGSLLSYVLSGGANTAPAAPPLPTSTSAPAPG
ncbi:Hsp70 family protein [Actinomycetes bacterium KLBMP 9759]